MKFLGASLCFILIFNIAVRAQQSNHINLPIYKPLKCGYIIKAKDTALSSYGDPIKGIQIYACEKNDSVFSLSKGKVLAANKIDGEYLCIIRFSHTIFTYAGLSSSSLKKGMEVKKGDFIGKMSEDDNNNHVHIIISERDKILNFEKHLYYIISKKFD